MEVSSMQNIISDQRLSEMLLEGNVGDDWKLILKPNWILRPDKKRTVVVEVIEEIGIKGQHLLILPQQAIILSLMDGKRNYFELINEAAKLFEISVQDMKKEVINLFKLMNNAISFYNPEKKYRIYNPSDYIVNKKDIDITTHRLYYPCSIILHICDSCIRNCIYCGIQRRSISNSNKLTTGELIDIIDQAAEMNIVSIMIGGGEPLLRDDLPILLERIHQHNIYTSLSTKAYISYELAQRLKKAGMNYIQYSIDSPDKEIADLLTGSMGFYEEAIDSITNLIKAGIDIRTNSVITPYNLKAIPRLVELLSSLRVYKIGFTTAWRSLFNGTVSDALFLNEVEGKWLADQVMILQDKYPYILLRPFEYQVDHSYKPVVELATEYENRTVCSAGRSEFIILDDGNVVLCEECPIDEELIMGNVKYSSLQEIWDSPRIADFLYPDREKYRGTVCYDCPEVEYHQCHSLKGRCWKLSLKAYNRIYGPSPLCPRAPRGQRYI